MLFILQFVLLFICTFLVFSLIKRKWLAIITSIIFGLFISLQLVSYFLVESLIDYKFYEHINLKDVWMVRGYYKKEMILGSIAFIVISFSLYTLYRFLKNRTISKWIAFVVIITSIVGMAIPQGGIVNNLASIYSIKTAKEKTFDTALKDLNIDPKTYVRADQITAEPGKNIIVISLESYEKGFLQAPMDKLTPNLNSIKNRFTYFDMNQNIGSDWTAASIYTSLTGVPAFFRSPKNQTFQGTKLGNIGNLGDVLQEAGYDMSYLLARKEFSGLDKLLLPFGFDVKSEKDLDVPKLDGFFWGLQDKELFEQATLEIIEKSKSDKPFAVFMNTISGHFPRGVYDARLKNSYQEQPTELEFMTAAVDDFLGTMFDRLEKENLLENTVVYIFPDHQFMGDISKVIKNFPKERNLFLISTAPEEDLKFDLQKPLTQIDLPRIIINGAKIKTNATFLTDYLEGIDKPKYVRKHVNNFIALNESTAEKFNFSNQIRLSIDDNKTLTISQESGFNKQIFEVENKKLYRIYFDENMHFIKCVDVTEKEAFWKGPVVGVIFSVEDNHIFSYLIKGKKIGIARQGDDEIIFTKDEIEIFDDWFLTRPVKEFDPNTIYMHSVGGYAKSLHGESYIKTRQEDHLLERGLNLLYIKDNIYMVEHFDTYENKQDASRFIAIIEELVAKETPFAIVADDSAAKRLTPYKKKLNELGFPKLAELKLREAYVGHSVEYGHIIEKVSDKLVSAELPIHNFPRRSQNTLRDDKTRFIAHAGGKIDGHIYTNSLEALIHNYQKGFRYFELDIVETSDKKLVAAHDWKGWAEKTGYKGELPPNEKDFLAQKINQKFTAMNMVAINQWFKDHPDAVLVTDKINDPVRMVNEFIDKDRLMMELFSIEAIEKGNPLNMKGILASNNIVRKFKGEEIEKLKELNVKYLAVSRQFAAENKSLFSKLKKAGITTYVFKVNFGKGRDEKYVFDYEIGLIYGMYADTWTFPSEEKND